MSFYSSSIYFFQHPLSLFVPLLPSFSLFSFSLSSCLSYFLSYASGNFFTCLSFLPVYLFLPLTLFIYFLFLSSFNSYIPLFPFPLSRLSVQSFFLFLTPFSFNSTICRLLAFGLSLSLSRISISLCLFPIYSFQFFSFSFFYNLFHLSCFVFHFLLSYFIYLHFFLTVCFALFLFHIILPSSLFSLSLYNYVTSFPSIHYFTIISFLPVLFLILISLPQTFPPLFSFFLSLSLLSYPSIYFYFYLSFLSLELCLPNSLLPPFILVLLFSLVENPPLIKSLSPNLTAFLYFFLHTTSFQYCTFNRVKYSEKNICLHNVDCKYSLTIFRSIGYLLLTFVHQNCHGVSLFRDQVLLFYCK